MSRRRLRTSLSCRVEAHSVRRQSSHPHQHRRVIDALRHTMSNNIAKAGGAQQGRALADALRLRHNDVLLLLGGVQSGARVTPRCMCLCKEHSHRYTHISTPVCPPFAARRHTAAFSVTPAALWLANAPELFLSTPVPPYMATFNITEQLFRNAIQINALVSESLHQ